MAPMWVGTQSNLTFRGVSPRLESQCTARSVHSPRSFPAAIQRRQRPAWTANRFRRRTCRVRRRTAPTIAGSAAAERSVAAAGSATPPSNRRPAASESARRVQLASPATGPQSAQLLRIARRRTRRGLSPRMQPQPMQLALKPGEEKMWDVVGMDLDGLTTHQILLHYDPHDARSSAKSSSDRRYRLDPKTPPVATIDREHGTVRITSSDGKPLQFNNGGGHRRAARPRRHSPATRLSIVISQGLRHLTNGLPEDEPSSVNASRIRRPRKVD